MGAVDVADEGLSEPLSTTVMTVCGIGAFDRRQRRAKSRAEESFSSEVASFNFRVSINSIVSPDIVFPFSVSNFLLTETITFLLVHLSTCPP